MPRKGSRASDRTSGRLLAAQSGRLLGDLVLPGAPPRERAARLVAARAPRARAPLKRQGLDGGDRILIVDTLIAAIGGAYCHIAQKRAGYAIDPVQALQLLRTRAAELADGEFHLMLSSIVTGLRDAHTRYSGPRAMQGAVAVLPFLVEQYGPHHDPSFLVSKVSSRRLIGDRAFGEGVKLETWNGIPFSRAVELYADRETGGRPDARRARALESLTFRALEYGPPPDEMWVDIGFRPASGARREVRIPWRVVQPDRAPTGNQPGTRASRNLAADPAGEQVRRAKKLMFSGPLWQAERDRVAVARAEGWITTGMQDVLAARVIKHPRLGDLGYLRVWSFDVEDDDAFIHEVIRLVRLLPDTGLILDLRGNPGGLIWAAERMLQLFTPGRIVPTRFSLQASPLTRAMARSPFNRLELEAWLPSLEAALATGEPYSQPLPLTDPDWCNDIGQQYSGPAVCIVDPNTYSSGDLFAAGFADNEIGTLVCVGEATGAGGANVWTHHDLREALADTAFALRALPQSVGYTIAIRRAVRSGASDGVPIEDLGVPGIPYAMTRRDLLEGNRDLLAFCGDLMEGLPRTAMDVEVEEDSLVVRTRGLDELETYVDGRPYEPVRTIVDGAHRSPRLQGELVEFVGRRGGEIRQRRKLSPATVRA